MRSDPIPAPNTTGENPGANPENVIEVDFGARREQVELDEEEKKPTSIIQFNRPRDDDQNADQPITPKEAARQILTAENVAPPPEAEVTKQDEIDRQKAQAEIDRSNREVLRNSAIPPEFLEEYFPVDREGMLTQLQQEAEANPDRKFDIFKDLDQRIREERVNQIEAMNLQLSFDVSSRSEKYDLSSMDNIAYFFAEEASKANPEATEGAEKFMNKFYEICAKYPKFGAKTVRAMLAKQLKGMDPEDPNQAEEYRRIQGLLERWNQVDLGDEMFDEENLEADPDEVIDHLVDPGEIGQETLETDPAIDAMIRSLEDEINNNPELTEEEKTLFKSIIKMLKSGAKGALGIALVMILAAGAAGVIGASAALKAG